MLLVSFAAGSNGSDYLDNVLTTTDAVYFNHLGRLPEAVGFGCLAILDR